MREIIFRGKQTNNGGWVYGFYLYMFEIGYNTQGLCDVPPRCHYIFTNSGAYFEVDPKTISQYTEVNDCEGEHIYGGDIVKNENDVGVVNYEEGKYRIDWLPPVTWQISYTLYGNHDSCEVIGNIHENPELLEVGG
ncbi:YopX family protein [Paenibacillus gorillae]|uniref:YopX family protein n=1 Tax=Paenibacillus gorillae TaxID=1243662 RepID=UPI0005A93ECE|nr:YopX family protein [Paenibacillus gorillae]